MKKILCLLVLSLVLVPQIYAEDTVATITIPEAVATDVVAAFADIYNYTDNKQGEETEKQFALRMVRRFIKDVYIKSKVDALELTRQSTISGAKDNVGDLTVE